MKKIAIHSVPRSGSSWVGQIINSSPDVVFRFQPLFSYAFKDYINEKSTLKDIDDFFKLIEKSNDSFLLQKDKVEQGIYPKFKKNNELSHVVYKEVRYHHILEHMMQVDPHIIVIGIIRNPYAVINSFLRAPREFRKDLGWNEFNEWRYAEKKNMNKLEEFFGYEKWKEVFFIFKKLKELYPERFYLLKYDNLLTASIDEVNNLFNFCDIKMSEQTKRFLEKSTKINQSDTYTVYKNRIIDNDWETSLNDKIVRAIAKDIDENCLQDYS